MTTPSDAAKTLQAQRHNRRGGRPRKPVSELKCTCGRYPEHKRWCNVNRMLDLRKKK